MTVVMSSPLVKFPAQRVLLPPRYFADIAYYAAMAAYGSAVVDVEVPFNKREKETHRCAIADTRGVLNLTVPVGRPQGPMWSNVPISPHGEWWDVHRVALESAYGRTPYFEFYIDRFLPFFNSDVPVAFGSVVDFDARIDSVVRSILLIDTPVAYDRVVNLLASDVDMRRQPPMMDGASLTYYQVRAAKLGFISNLSVLDLIFNLGPEAPLYLRSLIESGSVV